MNPENDNIKQAWEGQMSQTRMTIDADLLLKEVRRNQESFTVMIFWRDFREVGVALLLVPLWFYLGAKGSLPWTWYLTVPVMLWIAGFMLVDRLRHPQRFPEAGEPLRKSVQSSLAQVEHQIWLLRNVHWWAVLPMAFSCLAFFAQVFWRERAGGWWMVVALAIVVLIAATVLGGVYWLNQLGVRAALEPRRQELATLLKSLDVETPAAN
jgi:hypothetical protein